MNEEEKEAIETMNTIIEFGGDNFLCKEHRKQLQTILNLIDKQQKEIEELKKDKKALVKNYDKILGDFISKDKIREKIKELEREKQLLEDKKVAGMMIYTPYQIVDAEILRLKELLEENKSNENNI